MKHRILPLYACLAVVLSSCGNTSAPASSVSQEYTDTTAEAAITALPETENSTETTAAEPAKIKFSERFDLVTADDSKCILRYSDGETVIDVKEIQYYGDTPTIREIDDVMGLSAVCVISQSGGYPFYFDYYSVLNDKPVLIARSFGHISEDDEMREFYNVDIDGDGEKEFVANCVYGGDGTEVVTICKIIDGVPYTDEISYWKFFKDGLFEGTMRPPVLYSPEKNVYISYYNSDSPDEVKEYEYPLDYYEFEFMPLDIN